MLKKLRIILIAICASYSIAAFSWWDVGHDIVAKIAYERLNPSAKEKVDQLVTALNKEYPGINNFIDLAPWPDELRVQKIEMYTHWHYIDNAFSTDHTPLVNLADTDNAVTILPQLETVLLNPTANINDRARALAFLVHIVGDLHQPLHTVSRISKKHPYGDKGGNLFYIKNPDVRSQTINLHYLWDSDFGIFDHGVHPNVQELAQTMTTDFPEQYFGKLAVDLNAQDWAAEGLRLATTMVYKTHEYQTPTKSYQERGKKIIEERIALAGYRLANLLNNLFPASSPQS